MRVWISSMLFLTQYAIGAPDLSSVATTSTRSTPKPLMPSTLFDTLDFWSGESLKLKKDDKDCRKNNIDINSSETSKTEKVKSGRRRQEEHKQSTRFALADMEQNSTQPEDKSRETENHEGGYKLNGYTLYEDLTRLMEKIDANTSVSVIARTAEFHNIVLVKMSSKQHSRYFRAMDDKYVDEKPEKKIILIVHGLSPKGFTTIPCLYEKYSFMKLVKMYASHLDKFDIFLIPMGNPDGIADKTLLLWNKNKSPQEACFGVNVDRNFDVYWNKSHGASSCTQVYPGQAPFSEHESRAVADLIHHYNHKIAAYIHVHAGTYGGITFKGDALLFPKGHIDQVHTDDKYSDIEAGVEEAMRNAGFKVYGVTVSSLYRWYGQVSGSSVDYATTVYGIPYAMEFVMQPYEEYRSPNTTSEEIQDNILTEVWQRVIDVVFSTIYKSTTPQHSSGE
ncbi:mast cell carboxypeptidase A-like isoform X2 [Cydia splendana]|uniref:mast cell carboxypeptidase A-like isoform X2 n=1 Tax=Cydia splendana TaxID=1100963 RepID=UPI0028F48AF2